jgi:DNA-binding XRE family transcriptional regulator
MATMTGARCEHCGDHDVRLDENGWCEQCWLGLRPAHQLFYDLEELVKQTLETGVLTAAQLQEALRMSLADEDGTLPGTGFRREAVETDERGIWHAPSSAFDECGERRNRIVELRRGTRLSIEQLAARLGVSVQTLALWENDVFPSADDWPAVERLADLVGCSAAFLLGTDNLDGDDD